MTLISAGSRPRDKGGGEGKGGHLDPENRGPGLQIFVPPLQFGLKIKGGGEETGVAGPLPPLDPPLLIVQSYLDTLLHYVLSVTFCGTRVV